MTNPLGFLMRGGAGGSSRRHQFCGITSSLPLRRFNGALLFVLRPDPVSHMPNQLLTQSCQSSSGHTPLYGSHAPNPGM